MTTSVRMESSSRKMNRATRQATAIMPTVSGSAASPLPCVNVTPLTNQSIIQQIYILYHSLPLPAFSRTCIVVVEEKMGCMETEGEAIWIFRQKYDVC